MYRGRLFTSRTEVPVVLSGISPPFGRLFRTSRQVTHVLRTRAPLYSSPCGDFLARLACVRHAASVRSEPGSNSPIELGAGLRRDPLIFGDRVGRLRPDQSLKDAPAAPVKEPQERRLKETTRSALRDALQACYSDFKERTVEERRILVDPLPFVKSPSPLRHLPAASSGDFR